MSPRAEPTHTHLRSGRTPPGRGTPGVSIRYLAARALGIRVFVQVRPRAKSELRHLKVGPNGPLTCSFSQPLPGIPRDFTGSPGRGWRRPDPPPLNSTTSWCARSAATGPRRTGAGHEHRRVGPDLDHRTCSGCSPLRGGHRPRVHLPRGLPRPQGCLWPQSVGPGGVLVAQLPARDRHATKAVTGTTTAKQSVVTQKGVGFRPVDAAPAGRTRSIKSYEPQRQR